MAARKSLYGLTRYLLTLLDIRTWHSNIEQHASEGVNKILIGNKSDWTDKRAVTEEQGRELANELGIKFMETSAKINDGVEEAFFTLARCVIKAYLSYVGMGWSDGSTLPYQRHQDTTDRLASGGCRCTGRCCWRGRFSQGQPANKPSCWRMLFIECTSLPIFDADVHCMHAIMLYFPCDRFYS